MFDFLKKSNLNMTRKPIPPYSQKYYEEYEKARITAMRLEKQGYKVSFGKCASNGKPCIQVIGRM